MSSRSRASRQNATDSRASSQFTRVPHCCRTPPGCTPDAPAPIPLRSSTTTLAPRSCKWNATDNPTTPAPTTITSGIAIDSHDVRLRGTATATRRENGRGRGRHPLPHAVRRPGVPDRRRARHPELRRVVLHARLGRGRVLPRRPGSRLRLPAHVRRVPPAGEAPRGRARRRQRDGRRHRDLRARRARARRHRQPSPSATASGPRRRCTSRRSSAPTASAPARPSSTTCAA